MTYAFICCSGEPIAYADPDPAEPPNRWVRAGRGEVLHLLGTRPFGSWGDDPIAPIFTHEQAVGTVWDLSARSAVTCATWESGKVSWFIRCDGCSRQVEIGETNLARILGEISPDVLVESFGDSAGSPNLPLGVLSQRLSRLNR